jgi:hypothetical protein
LLQVENAPLSILVTLDGTETDVNALHVENALMPILVTVFGTVNDGRVEHPLNPLSKILVTPTGIFSTFINLLLSVISKKYRVVGILSVAK